MSIFHIRLIFCFFPASVISSTYTDKKSRWILWMIQVNFKKWNRITAGDCLTFPVNQQRFQVLVLCRAATNACHLTHGRCLDHRKTFLVMHFLQLIRPRHHYHRVHHSMIPGATGSVQVHIGSGTLVARDEDLSRGTIPMPTFSRRPSTISSLLSVDIRKILWLDSKDSRYRNCNSVNSLHLLNSYVGRYDSKTKWLLVLIFHQRLCYGSRKYRWSIHWMKENPHDQLLEWIFKILRRQMRELLLLGKRSSKILTSRRKSVLRCRKSRKRIRFYEEDRAPSWFTTTFGLLALMIPCWIAMIYSLWLFAMIMFTQDGTKFYSVCYKFHPMISWKVCTHWGYVSPRMSKIPSDDVLERLYKLRVRESDQLRTLLDLYNMEIHQKISMPNCQKKLKTMVKRSIVQKLRLRNFDARPGKIETGAVVKSHRRLCGPPIPIFEHKLVAEAHRYNCWEIPLDVLASKVQTLLDWANESLFLSRSDVPTFAESANQKTEWTLLSKRFPDSLLRSLSENVFWLDSLWHENIASSFTETPSSRYELAIKLSRLEW